MTDERFYFQSTSCISSRHNAKVTYQQYLNNWSECHWWGMIVEIGTYWQTWTDWCCSLCYLTLWWPVLPYGYSYKASCARLG